MTPSANTADGGRLLACTPGRLLFRSQDRVTGVAVVCKRFEQGSMADAQRELDFGRLVAHLDVAPHLRIESDARTGRPVLVTEFVPGDDLEHLVARRGPLPAAVACEILQPVARTLAAMHALRTPASPHGLCHGDVKPSNLLHTGTTTLLLDFEHARALRATPAPTGDSPQFTGGTRGFSPPEADAGAAPDAAFDVYGLGATLDWLLRGDPRMRLPRPPELQQLVAACRAEDPQLRPTAAAVAERLADLQGRLGGDTTEVAVDAQLRAAATTRPDPIVAARQQRVLHRIPDLLRHTAVLPDEPGELLQVLRRCRVALRAFGRHPATLEQRSRATARIGELLTTAATRTTARVRDEEFTDATQWLQNLQTAWQLARRQPGGVPIPAGVDPHAASPAWRDPAGFLLALQRRVAHSQEELADAERQITEAERRLDLAAAERAIGVLAAERGGAAPTAARRRDQLHRLAFYVDRIARSDANVERLAHLWDASALQPLVDLVTRCAGVGGEGPRGENGRGGGVVGLRSLSVTLTNLIEEYPHLADAAASAREALDAALLHTTDQAWEMLADAHRKLQAVPVPVRPLQMILGRLDTLRILEAFVDRPDRARSDLLDAVERLRLTCEEARSTRDRLASSAEQALARGHWTTGLFDMERAVASLGQGADADPREVDRLEVRLAQARKRKQEIESAVRRNVELAGRYATQQDEPSGDFQGRLTTLAERRDVLQFLMVHVPADRADLYASDLRDVEIQIALERAGLAESRFDQTAEPHARLQLAQESLRQLVATLAELGPGQDAPGRVVRLREHWQSVVEQCQEAIAAVDRERQHARRRRQRNVWFAAAAALTVVAGAVALRIVPLPWLQGDVNAASRDVREAAFQRIRSDPAAALGAAREDSATQGDGLAWLFGLTTDVLADDDLTRDALRDGARALHAAPAASLATDEAQATLSSGLTAAACLLGPRLASPPLRDAFVEVVTAAAARAAWRGLDAPELLRRAGR